MEWLTEFLRTLGIWLVRGAIAAWIIWCFWIIGLVIHDGIVAQCRQKAWRRQLGKRWWRSPAAGQGGSDGRG